jgi:hypothetical protein
MTDSARFRGVFFFSCRCLFGMGITEVRAINPFSKTDWEGTGVEPDVKVKAVDALVLAEARRIRCSGLP